MNRLGNRLGEMTTNFRWNRVFYLSNCSVAASIILIYLLNLRLPSLFNIAIGGPLAIVLVYLFIFLFWLLVEAIGFLTNIELLQRLYANAGLRWFDVTLGLSAGLIVALAWYAQFINEAIWMLGILAFSNCLISLSQLRHLYPAQTLRPAEATTPATPPAPAGAVPTEAEESSVAS